MAKNTIKKQVEHLLAEFTRRRPMRAGSLIVTLFGDTISQHGNTVWLGSVIKTLEPFGLNQRLVRTAVYRLVQDNWLESVQVGRKSFYSFTEHGLRHYEKAARRIYAAEHTCAGDDWLFVYLNAVPDKQRDPLRRELNWLGFGGLFAGVMAKPGAERLSLDETLRELGVQDQVVIMRSQPADRVSARQLRQMVFECWDLAGLQRQYRGLLERFQPLHDLLKTGVGITPEQAFQLRTLLIHDYRRLLLKDAELPQSMLPAAWVGRDAHDFTANLYRRIHAVAEEFVMGNMETVSGVLPSAGEDYFARFGGLD